MNDNNESDDKNRRCIECVFATDTGVLWCANTWTRTRVVCSNPEHIKHQLGGKVRGAASLYSRFDESDRLIVKSDVCCAAHCLDFVKK